MHRRRRTLRALFIGNSFTARNNLPQLVATVATRAGPPLEHELISAGGASLRRHWNGGRAIDAIRSGKFDCVVLQEQSTLPVAAYHVSGEYTMLKLAAERGYLDYERCLIESLTCLRRAGADIIFTYAAIDAARALSLGR